MSIIAFIYLSGYLHTVYHFYAKRGKAVMYKRWELRYLCIYTNRYLHTSESQAVNILCHLFFSLCKVIRTN